MVDETIVHCRFGDVEILNSKTPGSLAAEVKMTRAVSSDAIVIVEGSDDVKFWKARLSKACEIVDAQGKRNVVGCVVHLDHQNVRGFLGIVDTDYDSILQRTVPSPNLVSTDCHDLECLFFRSSALDKVLSEFGSHQNIRRFEQASSGIRACLLERALVFGRYRLLCELRDLSVRSDTLKVARFLDEETWLVNRDALLQAMANEGSGLAENELIEGIGEMVEFDPWYVVNGHDLIAILRIGLRRVLGSLAPTIGANQISGSLRVAMADEELAGTGIWADINRWQGGNPQFAILP